MNTVIQIILIVIPTIILLMNKSIKNLLKNNKLYKISQLKNKLNKNLIHIVLKNLQLQLNNKNLNKLNKLNKVNIQNHLHQK